LLPPPVDDGPTSKNLPPHILPASLRPAPTYGAEPCNQQNLVLHASVTDPDSDTLYYRVFYDYDGGTILNRGDAWNPPIGEVTLLANDERTAVIDIFPVANDFFAGSDFHTVELFVADGPFLEDDSTGRLLADETALYTNYMWALVGSCQNP